MLREHCIQLFQNEDMKRDIQTLLKSLLTIIYNEIYPYLLLICIYSVLVLLLILGILFLLFRFQARIS